MKIGLCMVVRNEANRIVSALKDIIDLFDDLVIIDTGSTDETISVLKSEFGVEPLYLLEDGKKDPYQVRNLGQELLETPWVLHLDADEVIERSGIICLKRMVPPSHAAGYFCAWNTQKQRVLIRDYKLSICRRGCHFRGCHHANVQYGLRQDNKQAYWLDCCTIMHYPEREKYAWKSDLYKQRLAEGIKENPMWFRYQWFLGYTFFCENKHEEAEKFLLPAALSHSMDFPVECLNSKMVLAEMYAAQKKKGRLECVLTEALSFYEKVVDDFEVKVNFRMRPWIENALKLCQENSLEKVVVYNFSY